MKPKRIKNTKLLDEVRSIPCLACCSIALKSGVNVNDLLESAVRSHAHHVISVGAGGDDVAGNLMSLCSRHHREIHQVGRRAMSELYPVVADWLDSEPVKEYLNGR